MYLFDGVKLGNGEGEREGRVVKVKEKPISISCISYKTSKQKRTCALIIVQNLRELIKFNIFVQKWVFFFICIKIGF